MATFDELVASYGTHDAQAKELKNVCDSEKAEIKEIMTKDNLDSYTAGGFTVKRVVKQINDVNEVMMLNILKKDWASRFGSMDCPYIRTIEVVDMDALESAMYNSEIPKEVVLELDKCTTTTPRVELRCSKAKKSKDE